MPVKKTNKKITHKESVKKIVAKPVVKVATKTPVKNLSKKITIPSTNKLEIKKLEPKKLVKPLIFLLILAFVYLIKDEIIVASVNGRPVTRWALMRNLEK